MSGPWEEFASKEEVGPWADFPSTVEPEEDEGFLGELKGAGETALSMVTGAGAQVVGGLAGLGTAMSTGDASGKGADTVKKFQEELTYAPRTKEGKRNTEFLGNILEYPINLAKKGGEAIGGNAGEAIAGAATEIAMDLLPIGLVAKGMKGKPKAAQFDKLEPQADVTPSVQAAVEAPNHPALDFGPADELLPAHAPQYGVDGSNADGMWTQGSDGHPFRADLSMDVPLMEQPLQRNLFGDDMVPAAGADRTVHQAMDTMADEGGPIPDAVNKLKSEVDADAPMKEAHYDNSDIAREGPFSIPKSQRGGVDINAILESLFGIKSGDDLKDFHKQMRGSVHERVQRNKLITEKIAEQGGYQWDVGDQVYSSKTGQT
jgi:hypothetical protein